MMAEHMLLSQKTH